MKVFLSYPSAHKETAASINYELQANGHDVFFDKEDLPPGQSYNERIRGAIEACDLFIFLITPESVTPGHYTLTELKIAGRKWPSPAGHVLPVMLEATPFENIPAYLKAVTILTPEGNATAEILIEVSDLAAALPVITEKPIAEDSQIESLSYRPVEIRFGPGSAGTYPVTVAAPAAGGLAPQDCPLDAAALTSQLWSASVAIEGPARRGEVEIGAAVSSLLPSEDAARRVGTALYQSLFSPRVKRFLESSLRSVDPQSGEGLRFLINTTDAPDLARLPWEFLYDPEQDDFLFSDRMKPIIRWLDVDQPPPKLIVEPPLRLLMAVATPQDRPELSVGTELAHLDEALRDLVEQGRVTTTRIEHTTLEKLDEALLTHKPHMLHFIGHGDFVGNDGVIFLEAENRAGADPITGRRLGVLLRNHLGSLRFVFLNTCLGSAVSRHDPFGGVAQNLVRRGVPAVIAMQFPIPDRVAVNLARHFYRYLAAGLPVDTALTSARAFLFARGYPVEWGAPALHMRIPDGKLFEIGTARQAEVAPPRTEAAILIAGGEEVSAAPPKAILPQTGAPPGPLRHWKWPGLLLFILGTTVAVAVWWTLSSKAPPIQPPTDVEPPALVRPPSATAPSDRITSEEIYRDALKNLHAGNIPRALSALDAAQQADRNGTALAALPELRDQLFDNLLAAVREALREGDHALAGKLAGALMSIDKQRASRELRKIFPTAAVRPPPAGGERYRVRIGDTLWAIAAAKYGEPLQWRQIYQANRDHIVDPDLIYPDQQLLIPPGTAVPSPTPARHSVRAGETLWAIAGAIYGDPTLWARIYDANRDQIENPDLIAPGQKLTIPRASSGHPSKARTKGQ